MRRFRLAILPSLAALLVLSAAGWSQTAEPAAKQLVSINLSKVTVSDGIDALFSGRGLNYVVEAGIDVKDQAITLRLSEVSFEDALKTFVRSAGITYSIEDGIYHFAAVKPVEVTVKPAEKAVESANRVTIHQSAQSEPAREEPVTTDQEVAATQPDLQVQLEIPQQFPLGAYQQLAPQMNPYFGMAYNQPMRVGNMTILNNYDTYTPPFRLGAGGINQYQPNLGWPSYSNMQYLQMPVQQPYFVIR